MVRKYSIKDLEHLTGIKAHTIRIWEQRHQIIEPSRTETNIRYYQEADLKHLLNISVLVNSGVKISKIAKLSREEIQEAVIDESQYKGDLEAQLNTLKIAMLEYDTDLFEKVLNSSIKRKGAQETFTLLVGSFIQQVGILWQTNAISIGHEHFASNLIKQKLYCAIDSLGNDGLEGAKKYLLYLPDQELHELGLLYLNFYLKSKGNQVIYFGQSVPAEYLLGIIRQKKIDALVSIFTTNPHSDLIDVYFDRLIEMTSGHNLSYYFTGSQINGYKPSLDHVDFHTFHTLKELTQAL